MRKFIKSFLELTSDKSFMHMIEVIEVIVAKLLSLLRGCLKSFEGSKFMPVAVP
jgi:hypothetical protein